MKYLNLLQLLNNAYIWWLKRELNRHVRFLEFYLAGSAFDLDVSPYEYRKQVEALRQRIRQTATKLMDRGVRIDDSVGSI